MQIKIPKLSLVVLVGPSGSGKSTFARRHFKPTEVLSSDACRGMVSDDENDQAVTKDAFEVLRFVAGKRLALGRLTVDRRHQRPARGPQAAGRAGPAVPLPAGGDRPGHARAGLPRAEPGPARPGLRPARRPQPVLATPAVAAGAPQGGVPARLRDGDARGGGGGGRRAGPALERPDGTSTGRSTSSATSTAAATSLRRCSGGSGTRSWRVAPGGPSLVSGPAYAHPEGRKAVFVGDLVDRGPRILDTVRLVATMVRSGSALCVPGNHDMKLLKKLRGKNVQITHGLGRDPGRDRRPARRRPGLLL